MKSLNSGKNGLSGPGGKSDLMGEGRREQEEQEEVRNSLDSPDHTNDEAPKLVGIQPSS